MDDIAFTDRELDVMSVLWRRGSGTVAEVRDDLDDEAAYTTVLKILQILEDKGYVDHVEEGRAYRYRPTVAPEDAGDTALGRILHKMFHGSVDMLVARLVSGRRLSREEVERLQALVSDLEPGGGEEESR